MPDCQAKFHAIFQNFLEAIIDVFMQEVNTNTKHWRKPEPDWL